VGAAVLAELRGWVLAADDDLGEGLVVAQQDVEARLELLDQVDLSSSVWSTMWAMRWVWKRPWAYWITRFFSERALPT
jgi:hypothetical protein